MGALWEEFRIMSISVFGQQSTEALETDRVARCTFVVFGSEPLLAHSLCPFRPPKRRYPNQRPTTESGYTNPTLYPSFALHYCSTVLLYQNTIYP